MAPGISADWNKNRLFLPLSLRFFTILSTVLFESDYFQPESKDVPVVTILIWLIVIALIVWFFYRRNKKKKLLQQKKK